MADATPTILLPDGRWFLRDAKGAGPHHLATADFVPSSWGAVSGRGMCGAQVEAIAASNYSNAPCWACLLTGILYFAEKDKR